MKAIAAVIGLVILGSGVGYAYSFGPTTVSYNDLNRGVGMGSFYAVGWDGARLEPTLKDLRADGMRTYIEGKAGLNGSVVKVQSDRRGDGKDWWATLDTKTSYAGTSTRGMYATTKVCMDRAWAKDPCKASTSAWW